MLCQWHAREIGFVFCSFLSSDALMYLSLSFRQKPWSSVCVHSCITVRSYLLTVHAFWGWTGHVPATSVTVHPFAMAKAEPLSIRGLFIWENSGRVERIPFRALCSFHEQTMVSVLQSIATLTYLCNCNCSVSWKEAWKFVWALLCDSRPSRWFWDDQYQPLDHVKIQQAICPMWNSQRWKQLIIGVMASRMDH